MNKVLTMREFINKEVLEAADTITKLIEADKDKPVIKGEYLRLFEDTVQSVLDNAKKKEENFKLAKSILDKDMKTIKYVLGAMSKKCGVDIKVIESLYHKYIDVDGSISVSIDLLSPDETIINGFILNIENRKTEMKSVHKVFATNENTLVEMGEMHEKDWIVNHVLEIVAKDVAYVLVEKEMAK